MLDLDAPIMVGLVNDALFVCKVNKSCGDKYSIQQIAKTIHIANRERIKIYINHIIWKA